MVVARQQNLARSLSSSLFSVSASLTKSLTIVVQLREGSCSVNVEGSLTEKVKHFVSTIVMVVEIAGTLPRYI